MVRKFHDSFPNEKRELFLEVVLYNFRTDFLENYRVPFDFQPKFPDPLANLRQVKHRTNLMISVFFGSIADPRNEFNCKREQHYLGSPVLGLNKLCSKILGKKVLPGQLCKALDACQA